MFLSCQVGILNGCARGIAEWILSRLDPMFDSSSRLLITGGTGSFGKAFIARVLQRFPDIRRLVVYSRDELKQWELQQQFPVDEFPQLRFFLGDVRDQVRLGEHSSKSTPSFMPQRSNKFQPQNIIQWNSLKRMFLGLRILYKLVWIPR